MSDLNRIEQNNAELRECIEIAESLPDAPETVNGYDIATMQKLLDLRLNLSYLYKCTSTTQSNYSVAGASLEWLTKADLSKVKATDYMFDEMVIIDYVPLFDTSSVKSMAGMFKLSTQKRTWWEVFLEIPQFNTSKVTNMNGMFQYRSLKNFPNFDFSAVTAVGSMFSNTTWEHPLVLDAFELPKVTSASNLFEQSNIQQIDNLDMPLCSTVSSLFLRCANLEQVGVINVKEGASISGAFSGCTKLVSFGGFAKYLGSQVYSMFDSCQLLETVGLIDMRNSTSASSMFYKCKALTNLTLKNIKTTLQVGSGSGSGSADYGYLLTVDSLVGLCYELIDTDSLKTLTVGKANLEKLASVYVRQIEITDEMRAEDDLIDEKLPFERCESTDEGATLIGDYVLLKNWKLA